MTAHSVLLGSQRSTAPVTVVIPHFNAERFIPACVDSVLSQTTPPREIILVDDGSEPSSFQALRTLQHRLFAAHGGADGPGGIRLVITRLARRSFPGRARNLGAALGTQPFIAFQDADDLWEAAKLERQVSLMDAWPQLAATHTDVVLFNEVGAEHRPFLGALQLDVDNALLRPPIATPSLVIRRDVFDRLGGFDESLRRTQDWDLHIRLALAGYVVQRLPVPMVRVRRQDHGHHSAHWRGYLTGHLRVVWKHRATYVQRGGWTALARSVALDLRMAGLKRGGLLGSFLRLPARVGLGA